MLKCSVNYGECELLLQPDLPEPKLPLELEDELLDEEEVQVAPFRLALGIKLPKPLDEALDEVEELPWWESVDDSPSKNIPRIDTWALFCF